MGYFEFENETNNLSLISISILKKLRFEKNWSQMQTALEADMSIRTLQRIEKRQTGMTKEQFFRLLRVLSEEKYREFESFYKSTEKVLLINASDKLLKSKSLLT